MKQPLFITATVVLLAAACTREIPEQAVAGWTQETAAQTQEQALAQEQHLEPGVVLVYFDEDWTAQLDKS